MPADPLFAIGCDGFDAKIFAVAGEMAHAADRLFAIGCNGIDAKIFVVVEGGAHAG